MAVLIVLIGFSLLSWTIFFAKWNLLRKARSSNNQFLRAFRKAPGLDTVAMAVEQFRTAPMITVFEFGYEEVDRQIKKGGRVRNKTAIERVLQIGISQEIAHLEHSMNWLATTAAVAPFIGLFGTVWGIIDAFNALNATGANNLRAVGPGIADALVATAAGLLAAIPAAITYNYFGHLIREIGARLEDFALEFLNLTERTFEE
jgi:biopolymer transport protein TolQ